MNLLFLTLSIVLALVISGVFWWSSRNLLASVSAFVLTVGLTVGLTAIVMKRELDPIARDTRQQAPSQQSPSQQSSVPRSTLGHRSSEQDVPVRRAALSMKELEEYRPLEVPTHGYVGSAACQECHEENHATWQASYHRTMTQVADPEIVLGNFDDVQVTHKGRQYILTKNDHTCMVNMPDEHDASKRVSVPIVMTTGSHHMQVYWFASGQGRMTGMLPLVHLNETEEWIPRDSAFLVLAHPTPSFETGRWNETCSSCHTTHRKGRRLASGQWDTHVGEFGISCEACHGPGQDHIRLHREAGANSTSITTASAADVDPIVNPASLSKVRSAQVCGQCHAVMDPLNMDLDYQENGHKYRPGKDLTETHGVWKRDEPGFASTMKTLGYPDLDTLLNETYYPDGMIRVSGREYNGLIDSSCYINGEMTCLSCHKLHKSASDGRSLKEWANDQLQPEALGDAACLQCHQADQYSTAHTHHAVGSSGAKCYNCHMPHTAYGLLKAIRNHQISSPDVGQDDQAQRPNACNLCHLDKTLDWSAQHLQDWYGIDPPQLDAPQREVAASLLWLLRGNAAERALSAWSMGWDDAQQASGKDWQPPFLASLLDDDYDAIRLIARRSLRTLPGMNDFQLDVVTSSSSEERQKAALAVVQDWLSAASTTQVDRPELLIKKSSGVQVDRVKQLIDQRDNTPMLLSE